MEGRTLKKSDDNRLKAAEMWFNQRMLSINWKKEHPTRTRTDKTTPWQHRETHNELLWAHRKGKWQPISKSYTGRKARREEIQRLPKKAMVG